MSTRNIEIMSECFVIQLDYNRKVYEPKRNQAFDCKYYSLTFGLKQDLLITNWWFISPWIVCELIFRYSWDYERLYQMPSN